MLPFILQGWKMEKKIKIKTNIIFGIVAIISAIILWILIPSQVLPSKVATEYINGSFMPKIMALVMFLSGFICLIKSLIFKQDSAKVIEIDIEIKNMIYLAMIVVYGIIAKYASFLIASLLFSFTSLFFMKEKEIKKYIIVTVVILAISLIFKFGLRVKFGGLLGV